ncbi:MAG: hypothetical protein WAM14_10905, partial [Candidatus Nitrosopolaris sp.]
MHIECNVAHSIPLCFNESRFNEPFPMENPCSESVLASNSFLKSSRPQSYETMPPSRLLALTISIISWLGWASHQKCGDVYNWKKIRESFEFGRNLSSAGVIF